MKPCFKISLLILSLTLTASCSNNLPVQAKEAKTVVSEVNNNPRIVKGKVSFPKASEITTKADTSETISETTVSIIYPSDSAVSPNKTIATGNTDSDGNFSINTDTDFMPENGTIYILEAIKRQDSLNSNILSVRTFIRWNGSNWESITSPGIVIDAVTTSLAIIAGHGSVASAETIGKVNTDAGELSAVGSFTPEDINIVEELVITALEEIKDPLFAVRLSDRNNPKSYVIDKNFDVGKLIQSTDDVASLGINLRGVNLAGANLSGKNFSGMDLTGVNFSFADLNHTDFSNSDLSDTTMTYLGLYNTDFSNSILTNSNFSHNDLTESKFTNVSFNNVNISNCNLFGITLKGDFNDSDISFSNLSKATLKDINFYNSKLIGVKLIQSYIYNVDFSNQDLSLSSFNESSLTNVKFTNANLTEADMSNLELSNYDLSNVNFTNANLSQTILNYSNVSGVIFKGADLSGAALRKLDLSNKDLSGINFTNANLFQANIEGANISEANFSKAKWIDGRICAEGSIGQCN